ncbi:hypothetical protein NLJ89_g8139 [Agrocybe chaxingu]|uniref:Fungal-type protein kinase domain-containing protein n=1 Tax=Agrocybe chaxingu TaxID=84603 RepID=A0A9W8MT11_9AGAR|nr:hypothetical protein NLJ89_g8139 [Agrocybe chaxingu]
MAESIIADTPNSQRAPSRHQFVLEILQPLQNAGTGNDFMKSWAQIVKSHRVAHTQGFQPGDPTFGNIFYSPQSRSGTFADFDYSNSSVPRAELTSWTRMRLECVGVTTFMAIRTMLRPCREGKVPRYYYQEIEAFIWVLAFYLLFYSDNKISSPQLDKKDWMVSDYNSCSLVKSDFKCHEMSSVVDVEEDFKEIWEFAKGLLSWTRGLRSRISSCKCGNGKMHGAKDAWLLFMEEVEYLIDQSDGLKSLQFVRDIREH